GINAGNTTITNVANGTNASDAVNVSQLNATNANVTNNTNNIANNTQNITNNANNIANNTQNITNNTAAINKGINFGNGTTDNNFALGDTINVTSDSNIVVNTEDDGVKLSLADNVTVGNVTVNNTFKAGDVTINSTGIDAGNHTITNVANGTLDNDAVNFGQLKDYVSNSTYSWNISANGQNSSRVVSNSTVDLANNDGNINITKDGNNVTFGLNNNLTVGGNGQDGQIGATGANGTGVVLNGKDGTIGINGKDGTNGTVTLAQGPAGVDGVNGTTRIVYEGPNNTTSIVATLDDGLMFTGNNEVVNTHKLNSTVTIVGEGVDKAASDAFTGAAGNINVKADGNGTLTIQLAKALTNLTSATFTNGTTSTVVNGNGVTINNNGTNASVSLTDSGLNNGGNKITNVAKGTEDTDAVNYKQLKDAVSNSSTTWNLTDNNDTANSTTVGNDSTVSFNNGTNTVAVVNGTNVSYSLADNIALTNNGSVTVGNTTVDNTGISVGDNVTVTNTGFVAGNVTVKQDGINAGGNKITGVADGDISANSTDAVNGGQLYNVIQNATAGVKTEVEAGKNIVVTNSTGANGQTVYTVETAKEVDFDKVTVGNVTINKDTNKVSGIANGDISATSSDAINGSQLYTANQNVADHLGGGSKVDENGNVTAPTYTVVTNPSTNATTTANNVGDAINGLNTAISKPLTFAADSGSNSEMRLGSTVSIKGGVSDSTKLSDNNIGVVSDGKGNLTVKLAKDISGLNSVTTGDTTMNSEGITINNGAAGSPVSLTKNGLNNGGNRITNVAPGEVSQDSTDAVNGSQLHATNQQVVRNAQAINQVANHVNKVDRNLRAGIAGAMAAGGLYHATLPGKSMVAAGVGTYRGESAIAVGYSRLSDNGKLGVKFSVNGNTRGDTGAAASVGYQW
ncbi:YadA family autotransporter adhesin, partial [Basfia succiniciproducens]|uniref:YadA family autotransporter adhesin n=1 Tax=Basfia succiniciproducens TaxID=653940 RepID=UPI0008AC40DD